MAPFVKICGICSRDDLEQVSAFGPDALGFVFWERSRRHVDPEAVGAWRTPPGIRRVGVFVDPSAEELARAARLARLDVLQVHRVDDDWKVDRSAFPGVEFWRALDPAGFQPSEFVFDRVLLDSYDPRTVGGTGRACDWARAREIVQSLETPVLLAGGLAPGNVAEALRRVRPWGVDVSSGVELAPGKKDMSKVEAFISACREP